MTDLITENARLRAALELAANRLLRCAVACDTGTLRFIETGEWANEARAALATPAPDAVQDAARVLLGNPQAAAKFVVEYMERETGLPFGDMIGLSEMQRIRAIAGDRT